MATESTLLEAFRRTLDDGRLSRSERTALRALLEDHWRATRPGRERSARLRAECFALARSAAEASPARSTAAWEWCEDVVQLVAAVEFEAGARTQGTKSVAHARFSPRQNCWRTIADLVDASQRSIDVCVFTVTDDRISAALQAAHRRGVRVRLVTDDEKSQDRGSDVFRLRDAGIPVAWDDGPEHMHHKFALFDGSRLLTGSYNWTRSAAAHNQENVVVTAEQVLVDAFAEEFERLWRQFAR